MASFKLGKIKFGFLETATSGGTLTLTNASAQYQILTGSSNHTVVLPDATTLGSLAGIGYTIINLSTGTVTVKLNDTTTTLTTLTAGIGAAIYNTDSSTSNGVWAPKTGGVTTPTGIVGYAPSTTKTSNYTVLSSDDSKIINVDTGGGAVTITLPAPVAGFKVTIKDISNSAATNNIIVARNGSELIDNTLNDSVIDEAGLAVTFETDGTNWTRVDSFHRNQIPTSGRAVFAGGYVAGGASNTMEYVTIATTGNGTLIGNLTLTGPLLTMGCSSPTRGIFAGAYIGSISNNIDYITISSTSNASTFGTLTTAKYSGAGFSSSTRGVFAGGDVGSASSNIEYITISTLGNSAAFGSLTQARYEQQGMGSSTRGITSGGFTGASNVTTIDYVTIPTLGNAVSFGALTVGRRGAASLSNNIRGVIAGGYSGAYSNVMDYITIATTGNAVSFGTLGYSAETPQGAASNVRGIIQGGSGGGNGTDAIAYITIATTGNSASFGVLNSARYYHGSVCSSHGGLYV